MHVWFGFIFRCEYWRIKNFMNNLKQHEELKGFKATFKTSSWSVQHLQNNKAYEQVSSSDSHSLIFSYSEISELKAKTSEWPRFTNIRRNYTNVLSTEKRPISAPIFSLIPSSPNFGPHNWLGPIQTNRFCSLNSDFSDWQIYISKLCKFWARKFDFTIVRKI